MAEVINSFGAQFQGHLMFTGFFILSWRSLGIQLGKLTPWKGTVAVAALTIAVDFINGSQYSEVTALYLSCHCALTVIVDMRERFLDTLKTRSWRRSEISSAFSPSFFHPCFTFPIPSSALWQHWHLSGSTLVLILLGAAAHLSQNTSACHTSHCSLFLLLHFFWVKFTVLDQRNIKDHLSFRALHKVVVIYLIKLHKYQ